MATITTIQSFASATDAIFPNYTTNTARNAPSVVRVHNESKPVPCARVDMPADGAGQRNTCALRANDTERRRGSRHAESRSH
jgi:hypothetical protein